jgi:hypothetical protein
VKSWACRFCPPRGTVRAHRVHTGCVTQSRHCRFTIPGSGLHGSALTAVCSSRLSAIYRPRSEQGQLPQVVQALVYQSLLVSLVLLEQIEVEQPVFVAAG